MVMENPLMKPKAEQILVYSMPRKKAATSPILSMMAKKLSVS